MSAQASCRCGRQWTGMAEAHCMTCHQHFSGVTAFDAHHPRAGGCDDPATLRRSGVPLFEGKNGPYGVTWAFNPQLPGRGHKGRW